MRVLEKRHLVDAFGFVVGATLQILVYVLKVRHADLRLEVLIVLHFDEFEFILVPRRDRRHLGTAHGVEVELSDRFHFAAFTCTNTKI